MSFFLSFGQHGTNPQSQEVDVNEQSIGNNYEQANQTSITVTQLVGLYIQLLWTVLQTQNEELVTVNKEQNSTISPWVGI